MTNRSDVPIPPTPPSATPQAANTSRSTQIASIVLLVMLAGLIGWRWYNDRYGTRPTETRPVAELRIDLNKATKSELMQIPDIGPQLAERIVLDREERGQFKSVDDLNRVHGIGDKTLNKIRPWLAVQAVDEPIQPERLTRKPTSATPQAAQTGKINVNTATMEQLNTLPNIGPVIAQRIIEERAKKQFTSVEDLKRVSGIGPKRIEALRDKVSFND
jgi:competence protein ComEA